MDLGLISIRYARALLKACDDKQTASAVYHDMQNMAYCYEHVPAIVGVLTNPMLSKAKKSEILKATAGNGCSTLTERFIRLVIDEGRVDCMSFIVHAFVDLYRKDYKMIRVCLTTAVTPSSDVIKQLRSLVEKQTHSEAEFSSKVDPNIIGGFVLEYDTYRMDASVKSQLNAILARLQ